MSVAESRASYDGSISPQALDELKSRLGKELRHLRRTAVVTDEWIERYALAIGDQNPLSTDRTYAERSVQGGLIAPPSIAYVLCGWDIGTGLPGVHAMFVRSRLEWTRPIREGDRLLSVGRLSEITEKESRFAGRAVLQGTETVFTDPEGAVVCTARNWNLRTERGEARKRSTYEQLGKHVYTPKEMQEIENATFREEIRGDLPRRWSEVQVGDVLAPIVKGPLTVTDMVSYMRGGFGGLSGGFFMYTHALGAAYRRRNPSTAIATSGGYADSPESVHWNDEAAQESGLPAAYDFGPQRIAWMAQQVTNWMGDAGLLRSVDVNLRKIVVMGDTTTCHATVAEKRMSDAGKPEVEIELSAINQRGEVLATGRAVAELPA